MKDFADLAVWIGSFAESRAAGGVEATSCDQIGDDHRRAGEEQANDRSHPLKPFNNA
jgi:hypothetical protein